VSAQLRLSDLLGALVEDESGTHVGHVHDLRAEVRDGEAEVVELLVGRRGALSRLGIPLKLGAARPLAWSDVVGVEPGRIVVRRP
jgi:sporulation protein YlmC with PRC-barrel domain